MLWNYLKTVFRNLLHRKSFSLINILGLAFGMAACLFIYLYVTYEKSYDNFNKNADNIYRLKNVRYYKSGTDSSAGCSALLGPTLKDELPDVIDFTRVRKTSALITASNQFFNEKNIFWVDASFLTMFSFPLISGDVEKVLANRYTTVITKSIAQKYFRNETVIGKTINLDGTDFTVTGVVENAPPNSHIKFDILLSFNTLLTDDFCWLCNNTNTYIQVIPGTKKSVIEAKLPLIVGKLHDRQKDGFDRAYFLQPLHDIHLYSNLRSEHEKNGNAKTIYFLSLIAIVILLLAWINYINLSMARSIERAKEVGLRKVVGAGFWTLVHQFLLESFIINLIAVIISLFIVAITYPLWNEIVGLPASFSFLKSADLTMLILVIIFINPLLAGIYPAFVLSSYAPVTILRGNFKNSLKGIFLRKGLVIFQFSISIILIAAIIVFGRQLSFMRNKNLGFDMKQKLIVNTPSKLGDGLDRAVTYNTFINELKNQSLINDATFSSVIPGMENDKVTGGIRHREQQYEQGKQVYFVFVAQNYLNFFDIKLLCGRNFFESEQKEFDQNDYQANGLIINERAASEFGFAAPEKAIGASIYSGNEKIGNVIGVIKDYHQQSLEKEITPSIFECVTSGYYFIFDINTDHVEKRIGDIKNEFAKIFPGNTFIYNFLDEFFDRQYKTDIQTAQLLGVFTFLSIFISCLGLIGLSTIMTIHRTKEIGIRKVLGASIKSLLTLLTKEFVKWVLLANVIAWPIAYYFLNGWLQNFAYRIDMTIWPFLLSGFAALVIALLTVSYQAVKAAMANPVESLRYE